MSESIPETLHSSASTVQPAASKAAALQRMIAELLPLSSDERRSLLETLVTFFELNLQKNGFFAGAASAEHSSPSHGAHFQFSEDSDVPSPKEFILAKSPRTDVERVACLAYYLLDTAELRISRRRTFPL